VLCGVGYHHAGMDVDDRKLVERMFSQGHLAVLSQCFVSHTILTVKDVSSNITDINTDIRLRVFQCSHKPAAVCTRHVSEFEIYWNTIYFCQLI